MGKKPNFIVIMPDQHRADILGCAGKQVRTPNLDRLASEGVRFSNTFSQSPLCVPSRASFMTGCYVHTTHCNTNKTFCHENCPELIDESLLKILKRQGYYNVDKGKLHLVDHKGAYSAARRVGEQHPELKDHVKNYDPKVKEFGFDECDVVCGKMESTRVGSLFTDKLKEKGLLDIYQQWLKKYPIINAEPMPVPKEYYIDYFVGDLAVKWLKDFTNSEKKNDPFFLFVGFPGPHDPFDCVEEYVKEYDPNSIEINDEEIQLPDRPIAPYNMVSKGVSRSSKVTKEFIKDCRAKYYGNVTLIDEKVGELTQILEDKGLLENTWIIYTSDHGEQLGGHKLFMKFVFYRSSVQVPLIIRPPKGMEGKVIEDDVELIDVPATILDILGLPLPAQHKGKSLMPFIEGNDNVYHHKDLCISQVFNYIMGVDKDWKFVFDITNGKLVELYNRKEDFYENNNLRKTSEGKKIGQKLYEKYFKEIISKGKNEFEQVDMLSNL
ncbi:MAG: sulfatase [Candidatus Aenigmatarchaeota archaeon]